MLRAELPGVQPDKGVQVTVADGVLTVRAERREQTTGVNLSEFHNGQLERSVTLPATAGKEHITAAYRNGILESTVPLVAPRPPGRHIPVTINE